MKRRDVLTIAAVGAAAWAGGRLLRGGRADAGTLVEDAAVVQAIHLDPVAPVVAAARPATLTLSVFSDYQCGVCRAAYPALVEAVRSDGAARMVVHEWPILGQESHRAARVALAVHRLGRHSPFHDAMMRGGLAAGEPGLREAVARAGLAWDAVQARLSSDGALIEATLGRTDLLARRLGLEGTPAYLIGNRLVRGAIGREALTRIMAAARAA